MAAEDNKGKGTTGGGTTPTSGQAAGQAKTGGQQISGEQIFTTTEENTGGESFATTGAGATGGSAPTGGNAGAGGSQANLSDAVSGVVSGDTGKAKDMLNQAKSATGQVASQAFGQVQEKASTLVDTKTSDMAQGLTTVANSIRQFTDNLRSGGGDTQPLAQTVVRYGDSLTNQVEQFAGYLDRADLNKLSRDVEKFAKKNPAVFIGGAFTLGILAARFIKSSQQRAASANRQLGSGTPRKAIAARSETSSPNPGTSGAKTSGAATSGTATSTGGNSGTTPGATTGTSGTSSTTGGTTPGANSPTTGTGGNASDKGTSSV
jgi:hypothetical protein